MTPDCRDAAERDALASQIAELQRALNAVAWRVVGPAELPDLTAQQLRVLRLVSREPGVLASGVGHHLGVSAPTASGIVDRLVDKGLLERGEDPADRRVRHLTLTDAGRDTVADFDSATNRMIRALLPSLDTELLRRVRDTYVDLLAAFRDTDGSGSVGG